MLLVSMASQRERAAVAAFQQLDATVKRDVTKATRDLVLPMVTDAAEREARTGTERRIAATARYTAQRGVPGVAFGGTAPVTSTGVAGRVLVRGLEFGAKGNRVRTFTTTSRRGKRFTVRRRVSRQFMPQTPLGSFIYPAMESVTDDVLNLWFITVEDAVVRAFDGRT